MSTIGDFFNRLIGLRSLENPSTSLANPDEWLYDALGGGKSASGVSVTPDTALSYSPVWRAVNLISRDVAKIPLNVYARKGEGKERAPTHPAYALLRYKPNDEMTAFQFKMLLQSHALLRGNGYAYINRRGDGSPKSLVPLDPSSTHPVRIDGKLWYSLTVGTDTRPVPTRDIFHIRGISADGLEGMSVVTKARDSFGLGMSAQRCGSKFFANDATPGLVFEFPGRMSDEAIKRFLDTWKKQHAGVDNKFHAAVIEDGVKLHQITMSNKDAQFLETRQFEIREVANWFGVPPHKLGDTTRTSYASLEQENQDYLDSALDPWFVAWEMECWDKLLTRPQKDRDTHTVSFLRQALIRANLKDRYAAYHSALQDGWMSRDEVRAREDMNPIPDGEGEKFLVALNMGGADGGQAPDTDPADAPDTDQAPPTPPPPPDQKALRQAHVEALEGALTRMNKRIMVHVKKQVMVGAAWEWAENSMAPEHMQVVQGALALPLNAARQSGLVARGSADLTDHFFEQWTSVLRINGTTAPSATTMAEWAIEDNHKEATDGT